MKIDAFLGELIAAPPLVYNKLFKVLKDPNSTYEYITQVINLDPGLVIRLLKIVNSPFYGFDFQIDSIPHAINFDSNVDYKSKK